MTIPRSHANPPSFVRVLRQVLPRVILLTSIALLLSAVMSWANVGLDDAFLPRWGRSFIASLIVLPLILASLGALERVVNRELFSLHWVGRKMVVALLTAVGIESVLAVVVTLINTPWSGPLGLAWWMAFSRSLPVGVLVGLFMSFYMKPKLDQMSLAAKMAG
jgi:hypothetical protein